MSNEHNFEPEVPTETYFARAAARRGQSTDELRARLRKLAAETSGAVHLSFEQLRDANTGTLSETDLAHLDQCDYCSRFLDTVQPTETEVTSFVEEVRGQYLTTNAESSFGLAKGSPIKKRKSSRQTWAIALSIAAGAFLGGVIVVTIYEAEAYTTIAESRSLSQSATATMRWSNAVRLSCQKASGETRSCQLFADAARYQLEGNTAVAQDLIAHGLESSGVQEPIVIQVKNTLKTKIAPPPERQNAALQAAKWDQGANLNEWKNNIQWLEAAQSHMAAGQNAKAFLAVAKYLRDETPNQQSTAFLVGFAEPVSSPADVTIGLKDRLAAVWTWIGG